jgi:spermidine/putrescine transport system permease protein
MTSTTLEAVDEIDRTVRREGRPPMKTGDRVLFGYVWLVLIWLFAPIAVMILFGFNDTKGRINTTWQGFTLKWYEPSKLFENPTLTSALQNSLIIASIATVCSVALGTLIGIALGKYRFRGQSSFNLVMFACISAPELVLGASLLSLFVSLQIPFGYLTIIIAHIMFSLSFVAVVVRSRVLTLDPAIEEAARDLGASTWTTFWRVTFPMIFPAVLSGGLLALVLSIDDFVVTYFTSGSVVQTFPLWIWGSIKNGTPPQVNVMGTLIFSVGVVVAIVNSVMARRRARR